MNSDLLPFRGSSGLPYAAKIPALLKEIGRTCVPALLVLAGAMLGACSTEQIESPYQPAPLFKGYASERWQGVTDNYGVTVFRGLPFAAPPVGELRWQPPQPYLPKGGLQQADRFAAGCMQGPHTVNWYQGLISSLGKDPALFPHPSQGYSEDCLYLNVWTPADLASGDTAVPTDLPVMVWIHGGSNKGGWPFEPDYRGAALARQDVVVVSIAYRLGMFGFFSHPELVSEQGLAGNYGLLDLLAALRWVQEHIAEFGGDSTRVTLFGESAGAANIGHLLASPAGRGLFHGAIHQSAGYQLSATPTLLQQSAAGLEFGHALNTDLAGLRALSASELQAAVEQHAAGLDYGAAAGGHALPVYSAATPLGDTDTEAAAQVPLLVGTNANEWLMYLDDEQAVDDAVADAGLAASANLVLERLGPISDPEKIDRLVTAKQMRCPSYELASAVEAQGADAWVYHFARVREGDHWSALGAYHGAEIPYVFDTHADWLETSDVDRELGKVMQAYWVNFARTGDPNGAELPVWQPWQKQHRVAELNSKVGMIAAPDAWLCELLATGRD